MKRKAVKVKVLEVALTVTLITCFTRYYIPLSTVAFPIDFTPHMKDEVVLRRPVPLVYTLAKSDWFSVGNVSGDDCFGGVHIVIKCKRQGSDYSWRPCSQNVTRVCHITAKVFLLAGRK